MSKPRDDSSADLDLYMGRLDNHVRYLNELSDKINKSDDPIDAETKGGPSPRSQQRCADHSRRASPDQGAVLKSLRGTADRERLPALITHAETRVPAVVGSARGTRA